MTDEQTTLQRSVGEEGPSEPTVGTRVREARLAAGMTQSVLAGDRFSKEYVSQIERGRTLAPQATLEWLAERLGTDAELLATGVSSLRREQIEAIVARAEAAIARTDYEGALAELEALGSETSLPAALELRGLFAGSWSLMYEGKPQEALGLLADARSLVERDSFDDVDRAEVMYRMGCCRYRLSSIASATALFDQALELAERGARPCDQLRAHVLEWRSRCYRRQRDWQAAHDDIERALELGRGLDDDATVAHVLFQASLVAERQGRFEVARDYAESARARYEALADRVNVGRLMNNLGGLSFLLGESDRAVTQLKSAFSIALDVESDSDAGYAVSSLAQVHLRRGEDALAERCAREALDLLGERPDVLDEVGNARLVLGRALMQQDRLDEAHTVLDEAEQAMAGTGSSSHRAAVWVAQGDLDTRQGEHERAAVLYRQAAEALQDFHF
ncbi:MAG: helix-turn-helix domain-containing protein [Gaiellaceae bacterium]